MKKIIKNTSGKYELKEYVSEYLAKELVKKFSKDAVKTIPKEKPSWMPNPFKPVEPTPAPVRPVEPTPAPVRPVEPYKPTPQPIEKPKPIPKTIEEPKPIPIPIPMPEPRSDTKIDIPPKGGNLPFRWRPKIKGGIDIDTDTSPDQTFDNKGIPIIRGDTALTIDPKNKKYKESSLSNIKRIRTQNAHELSTIPTFITQSYDPIVRGDTAPTIDSKNKTYKETSLSNIKRIRSQNAMILNKNPQIITQSYDPCLQSRPHEIGTDDIVKAYTEVTPGQQLERRKKLKNFRVYYEEKCKSINNMKKYK